MTASAVQYQSLKSLCEPLVKVESLVKYFPVKGGFFQREDLQVHAVDDVDLEICARRNTGVGRGVRLRQDHAGKDHSETGKAHVRASSFRGAGYKLCGESRDEAGPTQDASHLSGPIFLVEPAKNNREHYHGAFDHSSDRDPFATTGEGPGPDGRCRSEARVFKTVPTRVLRRSEAANRNRASAGV